MTKKTLLTGPEPEEIEEKTAAELEDEKLPAAMAVSSSLYDLAETDDRPAIEQRAAKGVIFAQTNDTSEKDAAKNTSSRNFNIDADFATEMHAREAKEKAEREKEQKAAEAEENKKRAERKKLVAEKLQESQTLDEEELKEEIAEEISEDNADKLYPDAKSITQEVEDELWRNRAEKGAQIAGRGKIEDIENTELTKNVAISFAIQIISSIIAICGVIIGVNAKIGLLLCAVGAIAIALTTIDLCLVANKTKRHIIPSNQQRQFSIATYIPGALLRLVLIAMFMKIPLVGGLVGPIAGVAIAASIHYSFLNRYKIYVSIRNTIINTLIYIVFYGLIMIVSLQDINDAGMNIIIYGLSVIEFFLGDRAAMQLALYTNK